MDAVGTGSALYPPQRLSLVSGPALRSRRAIRRRRFIATRFLHRFRRTWLWWFLQGLCGGYPAHRWQDGTRAHGYLPPAIRVSEGRDLYSKRHLSELLLGQTILAPCLRELYGTQLGRRFSLVRGFLSFVQLRPTKYQSPPDV